MISNTIVKRGKSSLFRMGQRFYAQGQEPHVFVNKHTKVICQGMTGKHVSTTYGFLAPCYVIGFQDILKYSSLYFRVLSTLKQLWNMEHKWLVV